MMKPPEPRTITAKEIEKKHKKIDENFKAYSIEVTESMKKWKLKQRAVIRYEQSEMYATINIFGHDWETGKDYDCKDESLFAGLAEEMQASMKKYSLKQQAILRPSAQGGLMAQLNTHPFDWEKHESTSSGMNEERVIAG